MAKEKVKTFHLLQVAKSLTKQNDAVFTLINAAQTVLRVDNPAARVNLELAIRQCREAMFPMEEG